MHLTQILHLSYNLVSPFGNYEDCSVGKQVCRRVCSPRRLYMVTSYFLEAVVNGVENFDKESRLILNQQVFLRQTKMWVNFPISCSIVHSMICSLAYHKVEAYWIPRLLTDEQKILLSALLIQHLTRFQQEGNSFLIQIDLTQNRGVMGIGIIISNQNPDVRICSINILNLGQQKTQPSSWHVMVTVYFITGCAAI